MNRLITLTEERLNKAKTPRGGYCKAQLQALGIEWPPKSGWKKGVIGKKVTLRRFISFVKFGKSQLYLDEINELLPTLNPPVEGLTDEEIKLTEVKENKTSSRVKEKLSKRDLKRERTEAKRALRAAQREQRIRDYGIHKAINLVTEKAKQAIHVYDKAFIETLLKREESSIDSKDVRRLYNLMKKNGIILSYRGRGGVSPSGHQKISKTMKEQFLYIIRDMESDSCKIGISKQPKARVRDLQTSNANKLAISMVFETEKNASRLEKSLHNHFKARRKSGEWFKMVSDTEIVKVIGSRAKVTTDY